MKIARQDIVIVSYALPSDVYKEHPAIVVSSQEFIEEVNFFYAAMISTKNYHPAFSFPFTAEMSNNGKITGFVTCHLMQYYVERSVLSKVGTVKNQYFEKILDRVVEVIFN
jgi:mRNA-degrading endonuclease toxin of MazEF toxin-antitoxin module